MRSFIYAAAICAVSLVSPAFAETTSERIQRVVSPGGIEAWLVEEHAIPMISVEIGFAGGALLEPEGKEGAGSFVAGMLDEGAGPYDSRAYAAKLDELSSKLSFDSSRDGFYVGMRTLTENAGETFELLQTVLTAPRFDEEPLERVRNQIIVGIKRAAKDPDSLASKNWYKMMVPGSPYARSSTEESINSITANDLSALFRNMVVQNRMKIGVVGDIDAETLAGLLDATFGALPKGDALEVPEIEVRQAGGTLIVEQDIPQSVAIFGHEGVLRDDPDFIPAYVMNYVLGGGGLTSRLTEEVREKNGLAYGVYSYLNPMKGAGLYMGSVATANERVAKSLELIRQEWKRMAEGGLSAEELDAAKRYLTGAYALRFDSNAKIARYLVGAQEAELGIDYIDRRNGLVDAVTLEDISRVAERLLHEDRLFVVVVGKPDGLENDGV